MGPQTYFKVTGKVTYTKVSGEITGLNIPIQQYTSQNITYVFVPYYYGVADPRRESTIHGSQKTIMLCPSVMTQGINGSIKAGLDGLDIIVTPAGNRSKTLQKVHLDLPGAL